MPEKGYTKSVSQSITGKDLEKSPKKDNALLSAASKSKIEPGALLDNVVSENINASANLQ